MKNILQPILFVNLGLPSGTLWARSNEYRKKNNSDALRRYGRHVPTIEQWNELFVHCTLKWNPFLRGFRVTGPNGRRMFLPARGYWNASRKFTYFPCRMGYYRSSSTTRLGTAKAVYFFPNYVNREFLTRNEDKFSVRTVK